MDESALKILIESLDICRSSLDSWLSFFTSLVTIGVVLEVVFVVWEYRDDLHDWRRGFVHPPFKPSVVLLLFGLFGATLVAVGVAGEWLIGAKIGAVETRIRKANDDRAILLSREAGEAKKSAEDAAKALDAVKKKSDALNTRMDNASSKLGTLNRRLAWRRVSPAQYRSFSKALLPFRGSKIVVVVLDNEDMEAKTFAADLMHLFHDGAKWAPSLNNTNVVVPPPTGLICRIDTSTPAGKALAKVMGEFPSADNSFTNSMVPSFQRSGLVGEIIVGLRSPP